MYGAPSTLPGISALLPPPARQSAGEDAEGVAENDAPRAAHALDVGRGERATGVLLLRVALSNRHGGGFAVRQSSADCVRPSRTGSRRARSGRRASARCVVSGHTTARRGRGHGREGTSTTRRAPQSASSVNGMSKKSGERWKPPSRPALSDAVGCLRAVDGAVRWRRQQGQERERGRAAAPVRCSPATRGRSARHPGGASGRR